MYREIKFRGKRISNGEWLSGDLMHDNIEGSYIYPIESEGLYKENVVFTHTVGQYTGLKDKNGVEIYEGDFLQSANGDMIVEAWYSEEKSAFMGEIVSPPSDMVDFLSCFEPETMIVVGNNFDNMDLLEEKNDN